MSELDMRSRISLCRQRWRSYFFDTEKPTMAPVVQKLDSAIHRINLYPVDNTIGLPKPYPLESDLSGG